MSIRHPIIPDTAIIRTIRPTDGAIPPSHFRLGLVITEATEEGIAGATSVVTTEGAITAEVGTVVAVDTAVIVNVS